MYDRLRLAHKANSYGPKAVPFKAIMILSRSLSFSFHAPLKESDKYFLRGTCNEERSLKGALAKNSYFLPFVPR